LESVGGAMLDKVVSKIGEKIKDVDCQLSTPEVGDGHILIGVKHLVEVVRLLCEDIDLSFRTLQLITGTDRGESVEISYLFTSFKFKHDLILKIVLPWPAEGEEALMVPTISHLFKAADWQERECFDMLGVKFKNHPDLRRLLCPDDWTGHPLRRDYQAEAKYNGIEIYPENKSNAEDASFAARQREAEKAAKAKAAAEAAAAEKK
jgi:NADH-quinone oxidoreductase subunit C